MKIVSRPSSDFSNPATGIDPPLLISDGDAMADLLSLSYLLRPKTRLQLVENTAPIILDTDRDIFLFKPSEILRKELEKRFEVERLHPRGGLWQLKKISSPKPNWSG